MQIHTRLNTLTLNTDPHLSWSWRTATFWKGNTNVPFSDSDGLTGIRMSSNGVGATSAAFGSLVAGAIAPATDSAPPTTVGLISGASSEQELFAQFVGRNELPAVKAQPTSPSTEGSSWCGGVVQGVDLSPGEEAMGGRRRRRRGA